MGGRRAGRRLPLREAAEALGVSKDALRQRIRRGTIRSEKGEDGRVYVYLDASVHASADGVHDAAADHSDRTAELIATLREQLAAERRANEENRRIIAMLTNRIPEIEPPERPPEGPRTGSEEEGRGTVRPGPEEGAERVPWWRRMFGG